jgi:CheY-like chemotaxis protein
MEPAPIPILLIEDNPADIRLLKELLREVAPGRFDVHAVRRLAEGVEALGSGSFPVILLDLSLPDAGGIDVIDAVRHSAPDTPLIVLSGFLDDHTIALAQERGVSANFVKGQDPEGLVISIDRLIAGPV